MEDWREHERRFLASGDQDSLRRAIAGRRRAGLHVPLGLLRGVVREARTLSTDLEQEVRAVVRADLLDGRSSFELGQLENAMRLPAHRLIEIAPVLGPPLEKLAPLFASESVHALALRLGEKFPPGLDALPNLERFTMLQGHLVPGVVETLRRLGSLAVLRCSPWGIDAKALSELATLPSLVSLSLSGRETDFSGLRAPRLERLSVSWSNVSIVNALPELPELHELRLGNLRGFGKKTLVDVAKLTKLDRLALPSLELGDVTLLFGRAPLRALELPGFDGRDGLAGFGKLERLEHLVLGGRTLEPKALRPLARLRLRTLIVRNDPVSKREELAKLSALEELSIAGSATDDDGVAVLAGLERLRALDVARVEKLTDAAFATIARFPALERLDARRTKLGKVGLSELAKHATRLVELHLPEEVRGFDLAPLAEARNLRVLGVSWEALQVPGTQESIAAIPLLEQIVANIGGRERRFDTLRAARPWLRVADDPGGTRTLIRESV